MKRTHLIYTLVALVGFAPIHSSWAASRYWDSGGGANTNWSTAGNWSSDTEPGSGDHAYINNGGTALITNSAEAAYYLYVGNGGGETGAVQMNSGDLSIGVHELVGKSGIGNVTQDGGTHTVTSQLALGGWATGGSGTGTYTLRGGLLDVNYHQNVGYTGTGYFYHSGGTNDVDDDLNVALGDTSNGTYQLSGTGQLLAHNEYIGKRGIGIFTQSVGTTNTISSDLYLGYYDGSGSYTLSGGELTAWSEYIGSYATGTFTQTGGTNTIKGSLTLGRSNGGDGTYTFQGGTLTRWQTWVANLVVRDHSGASGPFRDGEPLTWVRRCITAGGSSPTATASIEHWT